MCLCLNTCVWFNVLKYSVPFFLFIAFVDFIVKCVENVTKICIEFAKYQMLVIIFAINVIAIAIAVLIVIVVVVVFSIAIACYYW